ncbi:MAG TPA: exodeoxyribonuclease VII large subunit [Patescibacteria group bacterium]|nr:exodeoxyribonuclease VII large subunit [Patescibacteria group bacterium]
MFDNDDPFGLPPVPASPGAVPNAPPEYTVSELSNKLKRVIEGEFSFVRVRGEISKVTVAKSGHMYSALKDENACLDAVCWKGTMAKLGIKPEEGMDVVCTGRLTTYPGRSNYQLIIETMELAGQGALLKMLEDRKKKLAAEGLFDAARKRKIPFLPDVIGVVTSPTGAVIRDIMHRLNERFPRRVLLWPVVVQGAGAAQAVSAAIAGFNAIPEGSPERPDVIIVARGGGSLEDLMPFNDEMVVRAAAASKIPLISAVGHETDTTLIDHASDLRAPTPTAAAEKAVPVRAELMATVMERQQRMFVSLQRLAQRHAVHLQGLGRGLGDPKRMLENATQRLDHLGARLESGLLAWLERRAARLSELAAGVSIGALTQKLNDAKQRVAHQEVRIELAAAALFQRRCARMNEISAKLSPQALLQKIGNAGRHIANFSERLTNTEHKILRDRERHLGNLSALLESMSHKRVLERGYAVVYNEKREIISTVAAAAKETAFTIEVRDGEFRAKK